MVVAVSESGGQRLARALRRGVNDHPVCALRRHTHYRLVRGSFGRWNGLQLIALARMPSLIQLERRYGELHAMALLRLAYGQGDAVLISGRAARIERGVEQSFHHKPDPVTVDGLMKAYRVSHLCDGGAAEASDRGEGEQGFHDLNCSRLCEGPF